VGVKRRGATNVTSITHTGIELTFVAGTATNVVSMAVCAIEMTLVGAAALRTHSHPAAVDVRLASP
jgi:hypothetical protein